MTATESKTAMAVAPITKTQAECRLGSLQAALIWQGCRFLDSMRL